MLIVTPESFHILYVIQESSGMTMFSLTPPQKLRTLFGFIDPGGTISSDFNGKVIYHGSISSPVHTGPDKSAHGILSSEYPHPKGFETAMVKGIATKLKVTLSRANVHGHQPY